jgi:hypothetical protein
MSRHTLTGIALLLLILTLIVPGPARADEDHEGTLVLKVDGKDVTLKLAGGSYAVEDKGKPDHFAIGGEKVVLVGDFDLNGDGKADGKDKLAVDADENLKPASVLNKASPITPSDKPGEDQASFVELPGSGRCTVLKGSTFTVTRYKKIDGIHDRWSGTVSLKLKTEKGQQKSVQGRFDCGTGEE